VAEFLVELYVPRAEALTVRRWAKDARQATEELTREGRPVRYLRSIFVPDDETCFFLYEAAAVEDVEEAARRASLPVDHAAVAIAGWRGEEERP
jgi:hypothetical protein